MEERLPMKLWREMIAHNDTEAHHETASNETMSNETTSNKNEQ